MRAVGGTIKTKTSTLKTGVGVVVHGDTGANSQKCRNSCKQSYGFKKLHMRKKV